MRTGRTRPEARTTDRVRRVFGDEVADGLRPEERETVHGELHWHNVLQPDLAVLDREFWGRDAVDTDVATLHLFALPSPWIAARVHPEFRGVLNS